MILSLAVFFGLIAGVLRARIGHNRFTVGHLHAEWLVLLAVLPQLLVFFVPRFRRTVGYEIAAVTLVASLLLLLLFVWLNRTDLALLCLGGGLLLNLIVILANGGLMPISPETVLRLAPDVTIDQAHYGKRLGGTKDILLPEDATRLAFLSDRFVLPNWFPMGVAYSLGDILIAAGAFWFFWRAGGGDRAAHSQAT